MNLELLNFDRRKLKWLPPYPLGDPLHPLHDGKTESELTFYPLHYPLQAATEALHFSRSKSKWESAIMWNSHKGTKRTKRVGKKWAKEKGGIRNCKKLQESETNGGSQWFVVST